MGGRVGPFAWLRRPPPEKSLKAWAELLRVSALFTVPGDALAGAAALGVRPNRGTALAVGTSLCLYEAGMALNDWADRDEDAVDRPHRPIPSGRISPAGALTAAAALTAAGLAFAARAGRPSLAVGTALAAAVWSYDLHFKHTPAGPLAMGAARSLDLLLGATATASRTRAAPPERRRPAPHGVGPGAGAPAPTPAPGHADGLRADGLGADGLLPGADLPVDGLLPGAGHRTPTAAPVRRPGPRVAFGSYGPGRFAPQGGPPGVLRAVRGGIDAVRLPSAAPGSGGGPLRGPVGAARPYPPQPYPPRVPYGGAAARAALPAAAVLGAHTVAVTTVSRQEARGGSTIAPLAALLSTAGLGVLTGRWRRGSPASVGTLAAGGLAAVYAATAGRPLAHAALNPSPPLTQRAVGGGIRAMIPLQAALAARGGAAGTALAIMGLVPLARTFARKVSVT